MTNRSPKAFKMSFDGGVLERGFWVYVWQVTTPRHVVFYVGRTGDSSSCFAASPFRRIGQHLDFHDTAKANSLAKHLKAQKIIPSSCSFQMIALGPFFPEQKNLAAHRRCRDEIVAVESHVASCLCSRGFTVLGDTRTRKTCSQQLRQCAEDFVKTQFGRNGL